MSPAMLYRLSGLALTVGTLLAIPCGFLRSEDFSADKPLTLVTSPQFVPVHLVALIVAMLILLGLPGMYVRLVGPTDWLGFVGFVLTFCAVLMLGVVDMGLYTFGGPLIATVAPQIFNVPYFIPPPGLQAFYLVANLAFCVGAILFGRSVGRAHVPSHQFDDIRTAVGSGLIFAGLMDALASIINFVPILNDSFWSLITVGSMLSFMGFLLATGMCGGDFLSRKEEAGPIIGRPLLYGTLTVSVVIGYVLVVGSLGVLVQQTRGALILSLVAIGLVAILFQPLRDRLQQAVNRLVYGERDNPYAVLSRLGRHMEATLAPEAVLPTIVETIASLLKLPYVAIVLKQGDELTIAAAYGAPAEPQQRFPLVYQAEPLGALVLSPRSPGESLTPADLRLLHDLAPQIGVAVHAVRLTVDLQRLTVDLQRSRERLVTAREEERRRLRRDLHDGLGPTLAALNLQAGVVRPLIATDPAAADALVAEWRTELRAAIADIRRLVYELRPPALDELGLLGALRERAAQYSLKAETNPLQVMVEAPQALPPLSAAVEVAAYRIAQEALTNVVRHAQARTCCIRLWVDQALHLQISDDGIGLPAEHQAGVGLLSMRERAAELGGTCLIESNVTGGTRVLAQLPLPKE